MKTNPFTLTFFVLAAVFMLLTPDAFGATTDTTDAGLNTSTTNLLSMINNKLVPITLISGCLASIGLSLMKASPAPFIVGIVTLISFGFVKVWINTTYALCV
jgi:hypothetical protein